MGKRSKKQKINVLSLLFLVVMVPVSVLLVKQATRLFSDASNTTNITFSEDVANIVSLANQPFTITTNFRNPTGWKNLKEMAIWADAHSPRGYRLDSSIHAKLINDGRGNFTLTGERHNGGTTICGADSDPRHCGLNYSWDVSSSIAPGLQSTIYMNHDGETRDTTTRTENTIASVSVVSLNSIDDNNVEVKWQITPTSFFADRFLDIYVWGINEKSKSIYPESPSWRQLKKWSIRESSNATLRSDEVVRNLSYATFEPNQPGQWEYLVDRSKPTISLTDSLSYDGKKSLSLSQMGMVIFDLGSQKQGVLTARFYDDLSPTTSFYLSLSNKDDIHWKDADAHTIVVGVRPQVSSSTYVYKARLESNTGVSIPVGGEEKYIDTKISRTKGWHTVRFWITPGGGWAEIDDSTNQITYFNLSSLPIKDNQSSLTVSTDYELTEARYFRVGKWQNEGSFAIDQVSFDSLPPLPIESGTILSTFNGSVDWENYYSANFLDFYEDTSRFGNMERIDQVLRDPSNTTAQRGWWYESLSGLALAADVRYRQTNLPYYKSLVNNIVNFVITQNNQYPVPANDFFPLSMSATKYGEYVSMLWSHLTPENKALLKAKYISLLEEIGNEGWTRSRYIGDSTAEDYSWGPLYTNIIGSIAFSDHPSAQSWAQNGLTFARRALSTNSDEACSFCPNGKVGVKTIYAENETVRDCNPGETSENCMCIGDRAAVSGRSNSDFAYLVDNHDYSPHPNYMMSVLSGVQNSGYIIKIYRDANKDLPDWLPTNMADINPYTRKVWEKGLKSYDLAKNRYFGANIYRVRAKYQCDGQGYDVPQPYSQTNNSFRAKGLDDWGQLPTFSYNPSSFIRVKDLFGDTTVKDGTGRTYNIDELINKAAQTFFFKQFDSINTPVSPSVYIPSDKATIWGNINPFFVWNRQNGFHSFATRKGLIDTSVEFPLE